MKKKKHTLIYSKEYYRDNPDLFKRHREFRDRKRKYYSNQYENMPVDWFMRRNNNKFKEGLELDT